MVQCYGVAYLDLLFFTSKMDMLKIEIQYSELPGSSSFLSCAGALTFFEFIETLNKTGLKYINKLKETKPYPIGKN